MGSAQVSVPRKLEPHVKSSDRTVAAASGISMGAAVLTACSAPESRGRSRQDGTRFRLAQAAPRPEPKNLLLRLRVPLVNLSLHSSATHGRVDRGVCLDLVMLYSAHNRRASGVSRRRPLGYRPRRGGGDLVLLVTSPPGRCIPSTGKSECVVCLKRFKANPDMVATTPSTMANDRATRRPYDHEYPISGLTGKAFDFPELVTGAASEHLELRRDPNRVAGLEFRVLGTDIGGPLVARASGHLRGCAFEDGAPTTQRDAARRNSMSGAALSPEMVE